MSSVATVSLSVSGDDLDFAECTAAGGIEPSSTFIRKFDYDSSVVPLRSWVFSLKKLPTESINDALELLFDRLDGAELNLASFAKNKGYVLGVNCNITIYEERPLYELDTEMIHVLSRLDAIFGLDIFDYSEE